MRTPGVEEVEIPADRGTGFRHAGIGAQIDLLVFDRFPEAFDDPKGRVSEYVVAPGTLAVHADPDVGCDQQAGELAAGELRALSVLKISGLPKRAMASSTASMQKAVSIVIESRQARTLRLNQSTTAARRQQPHREADCAIA